MVIFLLESFLICLAAVTPEMPLPMMTMCSVNLIVDKYVESKGNNLIYYTKFKTYKRYKLPFFVRLFIKSRLTKTAWLLNKIFYNE